MFGRRNRGKPVETTARLRLVYYENTVSVSATDDRSGLTIFEATMSPTEFVEFMRGMGGPPEISMTFFSPDLIGKYHSHETYTFPIQPSDEVGMTTKPGPVTQAKIDALDEEGWYLDAPRVGNDRKWTVIRRRYTDEPVAPADSLNTPPKSKKKKSKKGSKK